ncbi:MAG: hypothetical protein ACREFY_08150 [Acetobacteraceae bacterium]
MHDDAEPGGTEPDGDDPAEAEELDRAAEWRLRKVDADPTDRQSAAAAVELARLAAELRRLRGTPLHAEYAALCNWLGESDGITEFSLHAHEYRCGIGFAHVPATGEDYLRALIELAKQTF